MGLIRSIKDLLKQYRTFGDAEVEALKRKVIENRELLLRIKDVQASNSKLAETAILNALKGTVDEMESIKKQADGDSKVARESLKVLEAKLERSLAQEEKLKTVELLQNVDLSKLLGDDSKNHGEKA
jgi:hypothetical protein